MLAPIHRAAAPTRRPTNTTYALILTVVAVCGVSSESRLLLTVPIVNPCHEEEWASTCGMGERAGWESARESRLDQRTGTSATSI